MVAKGHLVLVVEPCLVVVALAGVDNPLGKPCPDRLEICGVRLSVCAREVRHKVRVGAHVAVPQIEHLIDDRRQDPAGSAEGCRVGVAPQERGLQ